MPTFSIPWHESHVGAAVSASAMDGCSTVGGLLVTLGTGLGSEKSGFLLKLPSTVAGSPLEIASSLLELNERLWRRSGNSGLFYVSLADQRVGIR